jgi:hypothetical protein
MGGFAIQNLEGDIRSLTMPQFWALLSDGIIKVPSITKAEIEEKTQGDGMIKAIACLQVLYVIADLVARAIQHLPVSTLEIFTLAMIIMGLMLYAIW